jgi:hypothetical protein
MRKTPPKDAMKKFEQLTLGLDAVFTPASKPPMKAKRFVLSGNDLVRVENCPASRVFVAEQEAKHPGMWFGVFMHLFLEKCVMQGRPAALAWIKAKNPRLAGTCERLDVSVLPKFGLAEQKFGINVRRKRSDALDYDMMEPTDHVSARLDLMFERKGVWHHWDYKTGNHDMGVNSYNDLALLTCSVAVALFHGVSKVMQSIATIDSKAGKLMPEGRLVRKAELLAHYERLQYAVALTNETRADFYEDKIVPETRPSKEACYGCRARGGCKDAI